MLPFKRRKPCPDIRLQELLTDLNRTQTALAVAYCQFDLVSDPELVESCIYQIDSLKARYNYLIRTIKAHHKATQPSQREAVAAAATGGTQEWI